MFFKTFQEKCSKDKHSHSHSRASPGGQNKLKSNENTMFFNTFLENVAKTTVFHCFFNIARNRKTCRPELLTWFRYVNYCGRLFGSSPKSKKTRKLNTFYTFLLKM